MRHCCHQRSVSLFRPRDSEDSRSEALGLPAAAAPPSATAVDLAEVQRIDPTFDPALFLVGAQALFVDVRAALSSGTIDPIAGRLSPELTVMFGRQLQYAVGSSHHLTMTSLDQVRPTLYGAEPLSSGDLTCAVRYDVVGRMGQVTLGGDVPPATQLAAMPQRAWYEIWRLSRPAGAPAPPVPAACPNCGAPATGESHCRYCHALLVDATVLFRVDSIECMG
jgi:predicted lipid-binding transport protein (Tim44 family)